MGRAKLPIKYREQVRARRSTYMTRWKGLKKKTEEISLLCGVPALVAARSPEFNTVEFWPEKGTPEFHRIRERYLCLHKKRNNSDDKGDEGSGNSAEQIPCLPMSSSCVSTTLFHEEMVAMEIKLKEIRERLQFLQADSHSENLARHFPFPGEEEQHLASYTVSIPLQQDHLSYDQLPPDFATFNMFLQQDENLARHFPFPGEEEQHLAPYAVSTPLQHYHLSYDQLTPDFATSNMFLQQNDLPMINLEEISPPAPPLPPADQYVPPADQYYPCVEYILPDHAGFDMILQHDILYPFEQPAAFVEQPTPFDESLHHFADFSTDDPSVGFYRHSY
ncbi:uncharacterized protein LOC110039147 [Phalaenopsis equestris]|uniref:uncharacterized protein LOC110039147 n=1 Tax=Phalaenopsis equestris TaxID=78828 RepID=UPI0009E58CAC|nr:uncharacterized protein LOC110039147 [Phalaenopsis equestris]